MLLQAYMLLQRYYAFSRTSRWIFLQKAQYYLTNLEKRRKHANTHAHANGKKEKKEKSNKEKETHENLTLFVWKLKLELIDLQHVTFIGLQHVHT